MILLVWLVILAVYLPTLISGRSLVEDPGVNDVSANWMTIYHWASHAYRQGEFPLWNPHILCGMPLLGYTHCGGLYPPLILFFSLLPHVWAGSLTIIFHSLLAALLFFILMRQYRVGPGLAAAASLVFVLSGSFFGLMNIFEHLGTIVGLLFLWICLRRAFPKPRLLPLLGAVGGLTWSALSGEPELLSYCLIGLFLVLVLEAEDGWRGRLKRSLLIFLVTVWALAIIAPLLLSTLETTYFSVRGPTFPFHLTFPEFSAFFWWTVYTWAAPFRYYYNLYPSMAANFGLSPAYQGFLMLGLLIWGIARTRRNRGLRPLAVSWGLLWLWIVLRQDFMLGTFLERIPVLGMLKTSEKAVVWVHMVGVVLAFKVLAQVEASDEEKKSRSVMGILLLLSAAVMMMGQPWSLGGKERYLIGLLALALGTAAMLGREGKSLLPLRSVIAGAVWLWVLEVVLLAWQYQPRTDPARYQLAPAVDQFAHSLPAQTRYAIHEQMESDMPSRLHPLFGLFELASGAGNLLGSPRLPPARLFYYLTQIYPGLLQPPGPSGESVFVNLVGLDPLQLDLSRMHLFHLAGVQEILSQALPVSYSSPYSLLKSLWPWRVIGPAGAFQPGAEGETLTAPVGAESLLSSLPGDQLQLEYRSASGPAGGWLNLLAAPPKPGAPGLLLSRYLRPGQGEEARVSLATFSRTSGNLRLAWLPLADQGCRLLFKRLEVMNPDRPFQRQEQWGAVEVFKNREALPRVFIVHRVALIKDWTRIAERMDDSLRFIPSQEVVLEGADPEVEAAQRWFALTRQTASGEKVEIQSYGSQRVEMRARLKEPGFLVFSDTYFPGWRAYLREQGSWREVKVRPADLAFRAVFLLEGTHAIRWIYRPLSFRVGLWSSLTSLVGFSALLLAFGLGPRRRSA